MKKKLGSFLPAIAVLIAGVLSAGADTKNYSWNGTSMTPPSLYSGTTLFTEMANNRFHVTSPGGGWNGNQFGWDGDLADNEKVSGSMTIRVNDFSNGGSGLGRVRLLWFNAKFANGLNAFVGLYGSDKRTTRSEGWKPGGHPEWNKWEYNGNTAGAAAPAGKVYLFNSFNMNDSATDADFFRAVDKSTDHVLSWSAEYEAATDTVKVTTALDGVPWTVTYVGRQFNNLGWDENAMPKQHGGDGGVGAWDAEYTQINWATTTVPAPASDTKNYSWHGLSGSVPTLYTGGSLDVMTNGWNLGRFHVISSGGGWNGNQFGWVGDLADNEKVSGSMTIRVNDFSNGGSGLGRVRLLWFNAKFANGLNAFVGLYGSDKKTTRSEGWKSGGHPEWNKWEYNGNTAAAVASAGKVYLFNSFNMNDSATDEDFFRAVDKSTDHVLSWSAAYEAATDTVKVTTALDGVPWTVTYVGRQFNNLGWDENALPKQHGGDGGVGAWDAEYTQINWATTTVPAPASDTKNYSWHGLSGKVPTLYSGGSLVTMSNDWTLGRFHVGNPGGGWNGNQFGWVGSLANNEKVSGSMTIRVNDFNNGGSGLGRVRLLWFNATFTNGLNAFVGLYASDKRTTRSEGWYSGGHPEWNKWEYNGNTVGAAAPAGKVYLFNSFNMNDSATDTDFFRAVDKSTDHVLSWSAQYIAADVVRVTTALDGVAWTTTDVNRQFNNLGWDENALPKQHGGDGGPGAWDAEYTQVNWATTADAAPSVAIIPWTGGQVKVTWPIGTLHEATSLSGPWTPVVAASPYTTAASGTKFYRAQ